MKSRILILILVGGMILAFAGCGNKTQNITNADKRMNVTTGATADAENIEDTITATKEQIAEVTTESSHNDKAADKEEKTNGVSKEQVVTPIVTQKPMVTESVKVTENPVTMEVFTVTEKPEEPAPTMTKAPTPTQVPTVTPKIEITTVPIPTPVLEPNASAADCGEIADRVIEYINSYRNSPAIKLTGLTEYAEYRSRQLVANFAHDTEDERAAATALQYGTYIEPSLYGIEGTPYYVSGAREAIAMAGYTGTIDEVAESLANLVKNSSGHWAYVGSSDYKYIAVGITYENGMWYCDIAVATENTDNK